MSRTRRVVDLTRRQFCLQLALVAGGGYSILGTAACRSRTNASGTGAAKITTPALRSFTSTQFVTISAVAERLLPRDQDPGAIDLGVPSYIDEMLSSSVLSSTRDVVFGFLPLLDQESRARFSGKSFQNASAGEQDAILEGWQRAHDGKERFFQVVLSLTLEGAFGDPKYEGNREGRGFAMIGFTPDPPLSKMSPMPAEHHGTIHN